jgi:hypothetical protein
MGRGESLEKLGDKMSLGGCASETSTKTSRRMGRGESLEKLGDKMSLGGCASETSTKTYTL